jgi:hypothetical protein
LNLFENEMCPKCINCEFAGNKSWYVTFKHEEDAKIAFQYLKEHVRTFQGKPIFVSFHKLRPFIACSSKLHYK